MTTHLPPPRSAPPPEHFREAGYYVTNNSCTDFQVRKLYRDATSPPRNTEFWIKACRLGFIDSEETRVRVPTAAEGQLLSDAQLQN